MSAVSAVSAKAAALMLASAVPRFAPGLQEEEEEEEEQDGHLISDEHQLHPRSILMIPTALLY